MNVKPSARTSYMPYKNIFEKFDRFLIENNDNYLKVFDEFQCSLKTFCVYISHAII